MESLVRFANTWNLRLNRFIRKATKSQLRQLPCLHSVFSSIGRRCKRKQYQALGQDEEDDDVNLDDQSQSENRVVGNTLVKVGMLMMAGITVLLALRIGSSDAKKHDEFSRISPLVLYIAALELLVCGACSHTAAVMYERRRHTIRHPADTTEQQRHMYIKVDLQKEAGKEEEQLYGIGFRPSTDGLECLLVEAVQYSRLLDRWDCHASGTSPEDLPKATLGEDDTPLGPQGNLEAAPDREQERQQLSRFCPGCAIVAVNDVSADVGMMQLQLTKPKVTLWVRCDVIHPSQLTAEILLRASEQEQELQRRQQQQAASEPDATVLGAAATHDVEAPQQIEMGEAGPTFGADPFDPPLFGGAFRDSWGPQVACLALEDEEPQILTRWVICSLIWGWVTMVPVLLMQPQAERPRQKLFRQHLLKPCILVMPFWVFLWLLECLQLLFQYELIRPLYYFCLCHMVFPGVLVWYIMQMQLADQELVLEQRKTRKAAAGSTVPMVVEDPAPTLLRELISINPAALVLLGSSISIPLIIISMLTSMKTERCRLAQGYVNAIYAPLMFMQVAFFLSLREVRFIDLPRAYFMVFFLMLSIPCFATWCICLVCASRYGRQDVELVECQRRTRTREAMRAATAGVPGAPKVDIDNANLVNCREAMQREGELIYTA